MPSLTAYTPYETLAFCQSVASHGADFVAFENIAHLLNANQLIREGQTYDQTRLTADALEGLYHDLLTTEREEDAPNVNGDNGSNASNPRKRKLSTSPTPSQSDEATDQCLLQSLVNKLYARFREQTIKEIRQEEEAYAKIQADISDLEGKVQEGRHQLTNTENVESEPRLQIESEEKQEDCAPKPPESQTSPDETAIHLANFDASNPEPASSKPAPPTTLDPAASPSPVRSGQQSSAIASNSPVPSTPNIPTRQSTEPAQQRQSQPASGPPQHHSPGAFHRTLPVPSPQRPNYGPVNPQHFQPGLQGHPVQVHSPVPGMVPMPPPTEFPTTKRGSSSTGQGRGSPLPMPPQHFPGYPGYPQPPWSPQYPPQHQYPQTPSYPNPQYYLQSPNARPPMPYQTPHHQPYQPYPQSAPIHYQGQPAPHGWHPQPSSPYYGYHGSASATPVPRSDSRRPVLRGSSSTPWKRRSEPPNDVRPPSPIPPDREVSPITDTESPTRPSKDTRKSPGKKGKRTGENFLSAPDAAPRGRKTTSTTPSAFAASRSQSIASFASDTPTEKRKKGRSSQKIKAEPPSTPAPMLSDTEQTQGSSGKLGKPQTDTMVSKNEAIQTKPTTKRKRSPGRESTTPSLPSPAGIQLVRQSSHDSSLVVVSKNFTKTSQLLLNEIGSHKLAGIFAKPLSERDAPGYKDLVRRPQDLKSIKVAISKGGKATLAAIEALEEVDRTGEEPPTKAASGSGLDGREGPLGNGMYLVKTSEDLVPPRGIVNSSQLQMELVRMFANAVMFNPLPSSERGFGRYLRLRENGGNVQIGTNRDDDGGRGVSHAASSEEGTPVDEGGIIADTREMFEDIIAQVSKWREFEIERLGGEDAAILSGKGTQASSSFAHGSVSANVSVRHSSVSSAVNEDDAGGGEGTSTPVPGTGTSRKRRRIAEN